VLVRFQDENHALRAHRFRDLLQFGPCHRIKGEINPLAPVISRTFSTQPSTFVLTTNLAPAPVKDAAFASLRVVAIGIAPTAFANSIASYSGFPDTSLVQDSTQRKRMRQTLRAVD
jgi:hypothetical protein